MISNSNLVKFYVMSPAEINSFGSVHMKVDLILLQKIYVILSLGRFIWTSNFVQSVSVWTKKKDSRKIRILGKILKTYFCPQSISRPAPNPPLSFFLSMIKPCFTITENINQWISFIISAKWWVTYSQKPFWKYFYIEYWNDPYRFPVWYFSLTYCDC